MKWDDSNGVEIEMTPLTPLSCAVLLHEAQQRGLIAEDEEVLGACLA